MLALLVVAALSTSLDADSIAWQVHQGSANAAAIDAADSFEAIGITWSANANAIVRVRASNDRATWSEWITPALDDDLTIASEGHHATAITHFGGAMRYVEYSIDGAADDVTLTLFRPARRVAETVAPHSTTLTYRSVPLRSREEWACPEGESAPQWPPAYTTVTHAVVHHTAGANNLTDWEAEVRAIWYYHTYTNGWGDIGYNFLIDPNGVVYEGRAGGPGAIGAHFSCRNSNTAGVSLLGTFTSVSPTPAALQSLRRLLGEITIRNSIDPTAVVRHPSSGLNLPSILGHRDGNVPGATCTITECPGDVLYAMLPAMRSDLAVCRPIIDAGPTSATLFSGDTTTLKVTAHASEALTYQWYTGAAAIEGATSPSLTVASAPATYWVRIETACGTADSAPATISVASRVRRRSAIH